MTSDDIYGAIMAGIIIGIVEMFIVLFITNIVSEFSEKVTRRYSLWYNLVFDAIVFLLSLSNKYTNKDRGVIVTYISIIVFHLIIAILLEIIIRNPPNDKKNK